MIKVALNITKPNNYAFFCPISRLHLTRSNPVGFVNEVTQYIIRGLKSNVLIDVDNVIDLETGNEKAAEAKQAPVNPQPIPDPVPPAQPSQDQKESSPESKEPEATEPETAEPETAEPETVEPETAESGKVETPEEVPPETPAETPAEETPLPVDAIPAAPAAEEKKKGGRKKANA